MATLAALLTTDWDGTNVTIPTIIEAPKYGKYLHARILHIEQVQKIEDYMGILSRQHYTPDSHDAYRCTVGTATLADSTAIVDEVRRICAQFSPSSPDKILEWEGGDWRFTPIWYECTFVVMKRKSGVTLTGI